MPSSVEEKMCLICECDQTDHKIAYDLDPLNPGKYILYEQFGISATGHSEIKSENKTSTTGSFFGSTKLGKTSRTSTTIPAIFPSGSEINSEKKAKFGKRLGPQSNANKPFLETEDIF